MPLFSMPVTAALPSPSTGLPFQSRTQNDSPYNTYLYPGLPPGPICNPGYDSLFAAYHPTDSDYLYYITGNDNKMHYARTLEEHNLNISRYLR